MVAGIDLAGPTNHNDTSLAIIDDNNIYIESDLSDSDIFRIVEDRSIKHIGIDAPLSYSENGGFRKSDGELRKLLNARGYTSIGVMAPTYSRMIYLTSRGIRLSRLLSFTDKKADLYEVHPGAFYVFDDYSYEIVKSIKKSYEGIVNICKDIESRGYVFNDYPKTDHEIMAVGAALAVEAKLKGKIHWEYEKDAIDSFPFIA